jgi:hypothetical protein
MAGEDGDKKSPEEKPLTFWQIAGSTAAAAFGVQNRANRERDFARGKPLHGRVRAGRGRRGAPRPQQRVVERCSIGARHH